MSDLELIKAIHELQETDRNGVDVGRVVPMMSVEEMLAAGEERAAAFVNERGLQIDAMFEDPLGLGTQGGGWNLWVPADWWLFLLKLCELRLEYPGRVLEMFVSGGIRSGKSFIAAAGTVSHYFHTTRANVFCLSRTEDTSEQLQQKPVEAFLPPEALGGAAGKIKQTKHEKAKFSGGKFTDGKFKRVMMMTDETGGKMSGGGELEFRMFKQEVESYRGYALSFVWSDEAVPMEHVKALFDRLVSRAVQTKQRWHREKMLRLLPLLKAMVDGKADAKPPHAALLGALLHGVHLISYTPEEGYTPTVQRFLDGAHYPTEYKVIAPELANKPGVKDPMVPRIAYGAVPTRLTCFLHTSQNAAVNSYDELSASYGESDETTIRIKLYGDAQAADDRLFASRLTDDHYQPWKVVPRTGTIYVSCDPAPSKPWSFGVYLVDVDGRVWCLAEWPHPGFLVRDGDMMIDPGAWAVPSETGLKNGSKGPAAKQRLDPEFTFQTKVYWELLAFVYARFKQTGEPWQGETLNGPLVWEDGFELQGPFCLPMRNVADKRFLGGTRSSNGVTRKNLDVLNETEHAEFWEVHETDDHGQGIMAVMGKVTERINGLPGLIFVAEKVNDKWVSDVSDTIFTFRTYWCPDTMKAPPDTDQANKEAMDRARMLITLSGVCDGEGHCETNEDGGR